ncbi:hypothetical protein ABZ465_19770 [Streptomyces griseoincarnatus]
MSGQKAREPDGSTQPSLSEAASEARALAARCDVTVQDVIDTLRAAREARERA